jgi:cytochrome c oxidase assembly protein subunit 15
VYVHRTYSLLLVGLTFFLLRKTDGLAGIRARVGLMTGLALAETALGAVLYYFNIPQSLQPLHLLFSAFLFVLAVDAAVLAFLQVRSHKRLSAGA